MKPHRKAPEGATAIDWRALANQKLAHQCLRSVDSCATSKQFQDASNRIEAALCGKDAAMREAAQDIFQLGRVNKRLIAAAQKMILALDNFASCTSTNVQSAKHDLAAAYAEQPNGLSVMQRFAISAGNEPYADDKVCPTCNGLGHISSI